MSNVVNFDGIKPNLSIFPSYCSLKEATEYAVLQEEEEFNSILRGLALNELAVFEATGQVKVYTEADASSLKEKIKGFFEKVWEKIKTLFEKLLRGIDMIMSKFRDKNLNKKFEKIEELIKEIPEEKMDELKNNIEIHQWENLEKFNSQDYIKTIFGEVNGKSIDVEAMYSKANSVLGKYMDSGVEIKSISALQNAFAKWMMGEEVAPSDENMKKVIDVIRNYKRFSNGIKAAFNDQKKSIMKLAKEFEIGEDEEANEANKKNLENAKVAAQLITAIGGGVCAAYRKRFTEAYTAVNKFLANVKNVHGGIKKDKAEEEKPQEQQASESATIFEQEIDKLFAWEV